MKRAGRGQRECFAPHLYLRTEENQDWQLGSDQTIGKQNFQMPEN